MIYTLCFSPHSFFLLLVARKSNQRLVTRTVLALARVFKSDGSRRSLLLPLISLFYSPSCDGFGAFKLFIPHHCLLQSFLIFQNLVETWISLGVFSFQRRSLSLI